MQKHVMVMRAECFPGTEDAFNDWYQNVHLAEVVRVEGFVSAQRYQLGETDPPQEGSTYLVLYELETDDLQGAIDALKADAPNRVEVVGLDRSRSGNAYYTAIGERVFG
jgi:hypothetical protein